ncbi:ATP-binding cassette domain-containing protein [Ornithinimicrobium sp. Y1694]|uniref:ATP-binding cassette domain-containing protein n=1 Tax=Ornithinimicrobium sp. Y1694 TaxID=3418590 RepID=UPI003CF09FE1
MTGLTVATQGLTVRFRDTTALDAVTLDLGAGRIHGLLGRNGAGKTTLLSTLASMLPSTSGRVEVDGQDPFERESLMSRICVVREAGDVISDEKVAATLDLHDSVRPTFDRALAEQILDRYEVSTRSKPEALSRGQRSAVAVAIGLASRAPLTMFDEVHLGMDAPSRELFYELLLEQFAEHHGTVILSSHLIHEIEHLLETVTILDRGRVLLSAEADDIRARGMTITGRADLVTTATAGLEVIGVKDLGPTRQATVYGETGDSWAADARELGLEIGPVPLQDLFIHLTGERTHEKEPLR